MMKGLRRTLLLFAVAGLLAALPAVAESFTVILANGTAIESRYPPRAAVEDADKLLLLTEWGNWIALARSDVREVRGTGAQAGFDRELDTRPRFVGAAPNDAAEPEAEPMPSDGSQVAEAVINHLLRQNLAAIEDRLLAARANTVNQFGEPPMAGVDRGTGVPLWLTLETRPQEPLPGEEPDERWPPYLGLLRMQGLTQPPDWQDWREARAMDLLLQGLLQPQTDPMTGWRLGQPTSSPLEGLAAAPPDAFFPAPPPPPPDAGSG